MLSKPARQVDILIAAYSIPISLEAQKQCFIILNLLFVHLYIYEHLLHSTYLWTNYIFEHLLHTYVHLYIMNISYIHIIYSQQKTRNEHEKSKLNEILRLFGVSTNFSTFQYWSHIFYQFSVLEFFFFFINIFQKKKSKRYWSHVIGIVNLAGIKGNTTSLRVITRPAMFSNIALNEGGSVG